MTAPKVSEERLQDLRHISEAASLQENMHVISLQIHRDRIAALDELLALRHALSLAGDALNAGAAALNHVVTLRLTRAPNARENCVTHAATLRSLAALNKGDV